MNRIMWTIFIGLTVSLALGIPLLIADWVMAQAPNTTLSQNTNNTRVIWNMKDHTITLVNTTTNETKSIGNFTVNPGNTTTNETITAKFKAPDDK